MPLYFFDIESGSTHVRDDRGTEFESRDEVAREAVGTLIDVLRGRVLTPGEPPRCLVRDEDGRAVFETVLRITTDWGA